MCVHLQFAICNLLIIIIRFNLERNKMNAFPNFHSSSEFLKFPHKNGKRSFYQSFSCFFIFEKNISLPFSFIIFCSAKFFFSPEQLLFHSSNRQMENQPKAILTQKHRTNIVLSVSTWKIWTTICYNCCCYFFSLNILAPTYKKSSTRKRKCLGGWSGDEALVWPFFSWFYFVFLLILFNLFKVVHF